LSDGVFLPGQGGGFKAAEQPEKLKLLVQALEGKQLAVLHYLTAEGPTGSYCFGLEFTDGQRWIVMAGRSEDSKKYKAVLVWRMIPAPQIWTPDRRRHFASGRDADPLLDKPDELQQRLEGLIVRGLRFAENPTSHGGEEQEIEWSDGSLLILMARPIRKTIYHRDRGAVSQLSADIEYALTFPPTKPLIV
jgi:hypothetical protein